MSNIAIDADIQALIDRFELNWIEQFPLKNEKEKINSLQFQSAYKVYINKPQVVNKWVSGSVLLDASKQQSNGEDIIEFVNKLNDKFHVEQREFLSKSNKIFENVIYWIVCGENFVLFAPSQNGISSDKNKNESNKYSSICFHHLVFFDEREQKLILFAGKTSTDLHEKYELQIKWLKTNLMAKLLNWSANIEADEQFNCAKLTTLTLYDSMVDDYNRLYQQLKETYWPQFSTIWFEETNTDPEKFIHEDISIACYLILTWRRFKLKISNFVDLGCGNGLLVFILNDQGYSGYGVDMRKRKIWDNSYYTKLNVKLIERTIDAQTSTYPDCDWLIGNHSDELSPWLPIIANKTSIERKSDCNFMLIPCCLFDFYSKFESKSNKQSRFDTYVEFLESVANCCEYRVYKDKLRIPSTRNVCLIGLRDESLHHQTPNTPMRKRIEAILNGQFADEFKPRDIRMENVKSSRNCTKNVDNQVKQLIIGKVLEHILDNERGDCEFHEKWDGSKWNFGRIVQIEELVRLFDKELLAKLKQECGGIKTLLKNHHQLFEMYERESVKLRMPKQTSELMSEPAQIRKKKKTSSSNDKKIFLKTKHCLFDLYHLNGCLLSEDQCSFIHQSQS